MLFSAVQQSVFVFLFAFSSSCFANGVNNAEQKDVYRRRELEQSQRRGVFDREVRRARIEGARESQRACFHLPVGQWAVEESVGETEAGTECGSRGGIGQGRDCEHSAPASCSLLVPLFLLSLGNVFC